MLISESYLSLDGAFMLSPLSGAGFFEEMDWTHVSVDPPLKSQGAVFFLQFATPTATSQLPVFSVMVEKINHLTSSHFP